jgi:hypothetical protein
MWPGSVVRVGKAQPLPRGECAPGRGEAWRDVGNGMGGTWARTIHAAQSLRCGPDATVKYWPSEASCEPLLGFAEPISQPLGRSPPPWRKSEFHFALRMPAPAV